MSVSVSMPQLGESVTEGTVTRWLKHEGDHVSADEPLLEVSTDKVDTEIPSPVSGILRGISVAEDETVAVGAELAVIDEDGAGDAAADGGTSQEAPYTPAHAGPPAGEPPQPAGYQQPAPSGYQRPAPAQPAGYQQPAPAQPADYQQRAPAGYQQPAPAGYQQPAPAQPADYQQSAPAGYQQERPAEPAGYQQRPAEPATSYQAPRFGMPVTHEPPAYAEPAAFRPAQPPEPPGHADQAQAQPGSPSYTELAVQQPADAEPQASGAHAEPEEQEAPGPEPGRATADGQEPDAAAQPAEGAESPYVTPLVRKLAAEHGIDLASVAGTGVGGRIRKQDVLDAARSRGGQPAGQAGPEQAQPTVGQAAGQVPQPAAGWQAQAPQAPAPQAPAPPAPPAPQVSAAPPAPQVAAAAGTPVMPAQAASQRAGGPAAPPSSQQRGTTERLSRARQVIAQRMVESLQTAAQLTTVVEADVTAIARLRDRARAAFEAREGVKLSFLPFFAQATVEALKVHRKLNAVIDVAAGTVTYHDAEHLGIAVDTDRGLMVPVIRNAGDLNIGGLARKIADLAARTRSGQVSPDDLSGGTFTLTNTGSRGALFDTPIINMPQVGILGTGTVTRRAVVVDDPALGEVITVRSVVYLALTYDHRLVDGADAARFLLTVKARLEEGAFEAELGL